ALVPPAGEAQPTGKVYRIGLLVTWPREDPKTPVAHHVIPQELAALGYREGQNAVIEWRSTAGRPERRQSEAAALVQWKPDVVLTTNGGYAVALREASTSIPIVCLLCGDLVEMGLAASLARPGGTVTGLQTLAPELTAKRLQLIKELVPRLTL